MKTRLLLVVPCFNEAKRFSTKYWQSLASLRKDVDILFVDDGSTDSTSESLLDFSEKFGTKVHICQINGGKGEAVRAGFNHAISLGATEVGFCDADFAVDHHDLSRIFIKLNESPTMHGVIGSRNAVVGSVIERSALRHYSVRVFATLVSEVLKQKIYDTQCGAKAFRVNYTIIKVFSMPFDSRRAFDVDFSAASIY